MIEIHESETVRRPVESVYAYVMDFPRWPEWRMALNNASQVSDGPVGVGTHVVVSGHMMGRDLDMDIEITELEPNERIGFRTSAGPVELEGAFTFEAVPEGTLLSVIGQAEPKGVLALAGPLIARQVHDMWSEDLAALKGVLEG
jgi:uncharacterized membrane protein